MRGVSVVKVFFLVLARNAKQVQPKMAELRRLGFPFLVVCGEKMDHPNVVYRKPMGKWDAINFGCRFVPPEMDVVAFNDVDTEIFDIRFALSAVQSASAFVYSRVELGSGPQKRFYRIANPLNSHLRMFAMGELTLVRKSALEKLLPIPPCLAEDTYLLFKALELGFRADFCQETYVLTTRTSTPEEEALYKERTALGILQALDNSKPPPLIRVFYALLPVFALMLRPIGQDGRAWSKGIFSAIRLHSAGSTRSRF